MAKGTPNRKTINTECRSMHATSKKEQRATVAFRGLEVAELENV